MKNNAYFEELGRIGSEWEKERTERQEQKGRIIQKYGWDSEELNEWYEKNKAVKFPYGQGTVKAYRAWRYSDEELEMSDFLWPNEVDDFVAALRTAGIKTFIYTNRSSSVMDNIHDFVESGCSLLDLVKKEKADPWGEEKDLTLGIRFAVN